MGTDLQTITLSTPVKDIESYLSCVHAIPILTAEQEQELAQKLYENNDLEAARQLVLSHLRFVVHIARSYQGYGLPLADIIQEGNVGLMKAVDRFDPNRGVKVVSFAVHWIKAEIHEYILKNWRMVKIATTKAQRKLFFNLRSKKKSLDWLTQEEAEKIAEDLNVEVKDVLHMENRLTSHDSAFDAPVGSDDEETFFLHLNILKINHPAQKFSLRRKKSLITTHKSFLWLYLASMIEVKTLLPEDILQTRKKLSMI